MPTTYKGKPAYTLEELRTMLKAEVRKNAEEIPALLKKKREEYV